MNSHILCSAVLLFSSGMAWGSSFAGADQYLCGTATILDADPLNNGETGFWSLDQGQANFLDVSAPNSGVTGLVFGENILRWTVTSSAGPSTDQVSIWCYDGMMPMANAGPDQSVTAPPGTAQLNGSAPIAPGTCTWTVVSGICVIADPTDPLTQVSGVTVPTVLRWSCDNGPCGTTVDDVFLLVGGTIGIEENIAIASAHFDAVGNCLVLDGAENSYTIDLTDQQGRMVSDALMPAGSTSWQLPELNPGVYHARCRSDMGASTLRFVVTR